MGVVTLAGIGSLVSKESARRSFDFSNFRLGEIRGWRRAFNQANWVNISLGLARLETGEVAALAMVPAEADFVSSVALLDVDDDNLSGFYSREAGYKIARVAFTAVNADGGAEVGEALLCTACADDAMADALWGPGGEMERNCPGSEYVADWMRSSLRPLWPPAPERSLPSMPVLASGEAVRFEPRFLQAVDSDDFPLAALPGEGLCYLPPLGNLYPAPGYIRGCAAAHRRAGLLDHFLDTTVLSDYRTTLRSYLESNPELSAYALDVSEEELEGFS